MSRIGPDGGSSTNSSKRPRNEDRDHPHPPPPPPKRNIPVSLGKPSLRLRLEAYYSLIAPETISDEASWRKRFEQIYDSVGWYSKIPWLVGVSRKQVRALFAELPVLMAKFRAAVAADIAADPQLTDRLPEAYLAAMQDLR